MHLLLLKIFRDLCKLPNIHKCNCNNDIYFVKAEKWYKMNLDGSIHKCKAKKTYFCRLCQKANLNYNQVRYYEKRAFGDYQTIIKGFKCIDELKCFDQSRLNRVKERTKEFKEFCLNPTTVMKEHIDEQKDLMIKFIKRSGLEYRRYLNDDHHNSSLINKSNYWFNVGTELKAIGKLIKA